MDSNNWRCAPVTDTCASAFGGTATEAPVCQLQLQAVDLVPMPGSVSLVWHPAEPFQLPATTGQALYLALEKWNQAELLDQLCSPRAAVRGHSFVTLVR